MAALRIEPASLDDARAVAEIRVLAWKAAYRDIVSAAYLDSLSVASRETSWREAILRGEPEVLVARAGESIAGWLALGQSRDADVGPATGEVWALYVSPARWSSGVGRQLWMHARRRLVVLGFHAVGLWVLAENSRARRFYEAAGFEPQLDSAKKFALGGNLVEEIRYVMPLVD